MQAKKRLIAFGIGLLLIFTCTACFGSGDKNVSEKNSAVNNIGNQNTEVNYQELACNYAIEMLRNQLKNPKSLQVHSATINSDCYEDADSRYYNVTIDFSAQNGFGGYDREINESFIQIIKSSSTILSIDGETYYSRKTISENLGAELAYGAALDQIGGDIPLSFICSDITYDGVVQYLKNEGIAYSTFTNKNGTTQIECVSYFDDLECLVTFLCNAENRTIYQINVFWCEDQSYYDGVNACTLSVGYQASTEQVSAIIDKIDSTLDIVHNAIEKGKEPYFTDYNCIWQLDNNISLKMTWTVGDTSDLIGHIQLIACNEANQSIQ